MSRPLEALDSCAKQLVGAAESALAGKSAVAAEDLALLPDRIGPVVVLGHSQASGLVVAAVKTRRQLRVAVVGMEGNRKGMAAPDGEKVFMQLPMPSVFGDNRVSAQGFSGDARRNACVEAINFPRDRKDPAESALLSDYGMLGHSHMMMMDKSNLPIAGFVMDRMRKVGVMDRFNALAVPH